MGDGVTVPTGALGATPPFEPMVESEAGVGVEPTRLPFGNAADGDEPGMLPLPTLGAALPGAALAPLCGAELACGVLGGVG